MEVGVFDARAFVARIRAQSDPRRRTRTPRHSLEIIFSRSARILCQFLFVLVSALSLGVTTANASTQYFYDRLGRLATVINTDGSVIDYEYDANGNLIAINRINSQTLSIVSLSPVLAHVGASVTIYGTGFNTDPSENVVTIGGIPATPSSATSTSLVVSVPSGAETGRVAVAVGGANVTSDEDLVVRRPLIASFAPTFVNPGVAITLLGQHLNLVPGGTTITVGSTTAAINQLTNVQAVFAAPSGSGQIHVNTPYGQVTSIAPLIVVPAAIPSTDVVALVTLPDTGSDETINVDQANKYGLFQFDASEGQLLSIQLSSLSTVPSGAAISYQVYAPSGALVTSGSVSATTRSIHLPATEEAGVYAVAFGSSTATFQVSASLEVNASVELDGVSELLATTAGVQSKRFTFSATAGEKLGLGISNLVKTNGSANYPQVRVSFYLPDGSQWGSWSDCYPANGGCDFEVNVATTGVYTVILSSPWPASEPTMTMSFTATVSHDLVVAAPANTPTTVNLTRYGQNARVTFAGTAGAATIVQISGISATPGGRGLDLRILKPDGTNQTSIVRSASSYTFNVSNLSATGTYTLFVDPELGSIATFQVTQQ